VVSLKESEPARDLLRAASYAVEWRVYPAGREAQAADAAAVAAFAG
jgi:predicted esterase